MLPKGWTLKKVEELGEVQAGRQRSPSFKAGELRPYLRVANVYDGYIDISDVKSMRFTNAEFTRYQLRAGDILLNEGQSAELVGRPAIYQGIPQDCCFQNTLIRFRPSAGVDPNFALKLFQQCLYDGTFKTIAKKTTSIAHLGVSRFAGLALKWPPFSEQRRIAQILSTWDQAVATAERLLANSEEQKLGLMQGLLTGKHRLNGHTAGWQEHLLGKLFTERIEPNRADLQLLSITREQGVILRDDVGRKDTSNEDKSKYLRICPGDIGYNTMRMWQGVSALSKYEGIISPAYTVITPGALIDGKFASYLFKSQAVIFLFYRHSQGLVSDTWNLKFSHFAKIKIKIPCIQEQRSIAEVLEKADQQVEVIQRQLLALREEKSALMSQLLTGKRRVKLPDAETEVQA